MVTIVCTKPDTMLMLVINTFHDLCQNSNRGIISDKLCDRTLVYFKHIKGYGQIMLMKATIFFLAFEILIHIENSNQ